MQKLVLAAAILAAVGSVSAQAQTAPNVQGGSSSASNVNTGPSDFPNNASITLPNPPPKGVAALAMRRNDNTFSDYIPLVMPVGQVTSFATANAAGPFFAKHPGDGQNIAQVWYNNQNAVANVYSLRQVRYLGQPGWPHFGGLVIGQVKGVTGGNVFFGEWSAPVTTPSQTGSTDLNMASNSRTVWYVGDNAVTSMPALANATYNVVGIRQTGASGNLPHAPNLYSGTLTANYSTSSASGSITGSITRGADSVNFNGTTIAANGTFAKGNQIEGRFYNNAAALAGIYKGGGAAGNVAFGGNRSN